MILGSLNTNNQNVTVIGGGVAGLIATYRLLKSGYRVTLYEKENRAGGLIQTLQTPYGIAESAVHSVPGTEAARQLFQELDIDIAECAQDAKTGLIWRKGKMRKWPLAFLETTKLFFCAATVRSDELPKSLSNWAEHHMGSRALHNLLAPMTTGIYGTTPDRLEMPIAFPAMNISKGKTLFEHLWKRRKNKRPPPIVPKQGMEKLIVSLEKYIKDHPNAFLVTGLEMLYLDEEENNVLICTPPDIAATLLQDKFPDLAKALRNIDFSPLVTATIFVKQGEINILKPAFGVLFPPAEQSNILGILFNSVCFENRATVGFHSFTFMLGGTLQPEMLQKTNEEIKDIIQEGLQKYLGWKGKFFDCTITRWPKAVPLYNTAIRELQEQAAQNLTCPGIALFGNYTGNVALRSLIECNLNLPFGS